MRQQYVITAGKNKSDRQLYVAGFIDDPDYWSISVVPFVTTKTRCYELLAKVKRDMKEKAKGITIKLPKSEIPFEIVEWNE